MNTKKAGDMSSIFAALRNAACGYEPPKFKKRAIGKPIRVTTIVRIGGQTFIPGETTHMLEPTSTEKGCSYRCKCGWECFFPREKMFGDIRKAGEAVTAHLKGQ